MRAFDTAWTLLKADKTDYDEINKAYIMRKAAFKLQYDYSTLRKQYEDLYDDGPPMDEFEEAQAQFDADGGTIFPDHKPRNEKEQRILHHYMEKLGIIPGLSAVEQGMDDDEHALASDVAQEYFVEHLNEMNAMDTGVSGRDSAPSRIGVSAPQIPEQRNNQ
tara:strand:+ start:291 stop:776 length:486 start_codon:yes stop_codon:yes gene_type:complete